jgi:excisionase family DNA binding protein
VPTIAGAVSRDVVLSKLLTIAQVADTVGVTTRTVWNWIKKGRLPVVRLGRTVRIKEEDFRRFIDEATDEKKLDEIK